ncbi:hypothetical protein TEA_005610 [Camellia sinensis var. sinensis]|uniref:Uncharacterized protein n=1 Tax=Camellia sinensis var. sinensis TaxID=542762 RepID=A0A4S4EJB5_CAMSN|nr:hypothetical protein TEA_005610 [Camellia sinensis var. sinensis]
MRRREREREKHRESDEDEDDRESDEDDRESDEDDRSPFSSHVDVEELLVPKIEGEEPPLFENFLTGICQTREKHAVQAIIGMLKSSVKAWIFGAAKLIGRLIINPDNEPFILPFGPQFQLNLSEQKCDLRESSLAKVESQRRNASNFHCPSPDYEIKETKNIYVDSNESLNGTEGTNSVKVQADLISVLMEKMKILTLGNESLNGTEGTNSVKVVCHFLERNNIKGAIDATRKLPDHSVGTSRPDQCSHGENEDSYLRFALNKMGG